MKKNTAYTIGSVIILLICAFAFVVLPAMTGNTAKGGDLPAFGKYNGKEIKYEQGSDFANAVSQYGQMYQAYGQQIDSNTYFRIFNMAFNSTVTKYAYEDFTKTSGYIVPKTAVNRRMIPYFYDENGKYSDKLYKQTSEDTIRDLRSNIEASLYSTRFYDDNFGSDDEIVGKQQLYGLKESDAELDFLKSYNTSKRGFHMAVFDLSTYPEEEKINYGNANKAKFVKYDLSLITVDDESTAKTVAKRLTNNEITFEDAVTEYSNKNHSDSEGKITNGYQYQIELILDDKADLAKITSLSKDSVSEIIKTTSGYAIFKANGEPVQPDFTVEQTKNMLSSYLTAYESTMIEDYFTAKAKDFTNEALKTDFQTACETLSVDNAEIAPFPLNYGSMDISESVDTSLKGLSGADTNENFLKTAFSLKMNEISEPILINRNIVVLQYTTEENLAADDEGSPFAIGSLASYDEDAVSSAIMASDKLENNFIEVYLDNFMGN